MKKLLLGAMTLLLSASLVACGTDSAKKENATGDAGNGVVTLKVGATPVPHEEILKHVAPQLEKEGVHLEIVSFNDYIQPNVQLGDKQLDANFFQHIPYLEDFSKERNLDLTHIAGVHIEPMGAYSKKYKKASDLPDGATIAVPNDVTQVGRSLALLEKNGLIKLKAGVGISGTLKDIVENNKKFKFNELEAAMLPRVLPEVDLAVINTNFALQVDLVPTKDALFIEDKDSPYVNVLAVRTEDKDNAALQKLAKALNSEDVKKFINDKYKGAIVPAF
ncbi:D-methionine transport system substrate-binding protein [Tumebacillus sp. BK434]|uniref:MetQ/NlpA family ABC transporter substrate-binding protein n=1 Tax=Tumebacillus sp. BK434 TaxID=2512169 RepID=UPI001048C45A|nr:MetQ/NlpA family ABC transporter substrate-binding protein [Tumebacillus sp. BK434]TCP54392.1 D-methionine transport system substrate-binding protein [Tumebacillus sp. BK434]